MLLAIIVDLVLLGIIGLGVYYGISKGFVTMAAKPFKTFFALIVAYTCSSWFAKLIVVPIVRAPITGYVSDFLYKNIPNVSPDTAAEELPTLLKMAAAAFGVNYQGEIDGKSYLDTLCTTLSAPVVNLVSIIISAIALFFIGKLLFSLALFLLNKFCENGVLEKVNKVLGIVFGSFIFVIVAWAIAVLLSVIFHLPAFDSNEAVSGFEGFLVYRLLNAFNPIVILLSF